VIYSYNKRGQDALFLNFILVKNSTCQKNSTYFAQTYCPTSGVLILYSQQLVFVILMMLTVCQRGQDGSRPRWQTVNVTNMTNTSYCEYSIKTPDDGQ
jgi:hypothetical protein